MWRACGCRRGGRARHARFAENVILLLAWRQEIRKPFTAPVYRGQ
jgi:hypothetical protein